MIQKIIKVGNSAAITIPKDFLNGTGFKIGDEIKVEADTVAKMMIIKSPKQGDYRSLTPEFFKWLKDISEKHEDTIKALARV